MTHSGFPTTFTIILTISDHFYNYNLPWMVVSFKTVCRYSFKRWSIRAIQSIFISSSSLTLFKAAIVIFFQKVEYQSHSEHFRFFFFPYPFQSHSRSIPELEHKGFHI
ncbi:hypothetical protein DVH24_022472 [Malus domestica]|uniref:Uncharacterized protein n=1 Tax=Malus domestica TaxID=3750 RepID=A0A498KKS9_MALDO|nr:hypothetical protein DVH24_022472 [Malus domestica]